MRSMGGVHIVSKFQYIQREYRWHVNIKNFLADTYTAKLDLSSPLRAGKKKQAV